MKPVLYLALTLALAVNTQAGLFGPSGDTIAQKKATVLKQRDEMLEQLYAANPAMRKDLKKAAGYATFAQTSVNLFLLASANGYGVVVDNKSHKKTYMRMGSLGGGIGAGVKDVRVVFVFRDPKVMKTFIDEGWQVGGQADAAAKYQNTGASDEQNVKGNVDFRDGTIAAGSSTDAQANDGSQAGQANLAMGGGLEVYQFTTSGVALQATVSGTKYWKDSELNQ